MNKKIKLLAKVLLLSFIFSNINPVTHFAMESKQEFFSKICLCDKYVKNEWIQNRKFRNNSL